MKKIVIIASTGGSVLSKVLHLPSIQNSIFMVVSDRQCTALDVAQKFGVDTKILSAKSGKEFSIKLVDFFKDKDVSYFLSFYTRIFTEELLNTYEDKVLNFHPSILPACPGTDGFGDTVRSGAKFIGSTLHFVDLGIDTGMPLIQSSFPYQPSLTLKQNRHRVFIQQCKIFIQFIEWDNQNRIKDCSVLESKYELSEFVPNLDSNLAIEFDC
ncbi:phosphoribosylglycinamide formyltransferase [Psychrobacter frigidicola]|uniref:phosphoribosylglycinamide formyltransferase n=1 Tax=Psychrobacter frigidicola TaxID=45611 RepID=UPI00191834E5|nr:formyltransferase family protein [Psychrobacter frigidicola]